MVWFGHSSYFIQLDGKKLLVDPVFSNYASPFPWVNKTFKGTDLYLVDDMPEIDYLLVTHDHYDHLDYHTILNLKSKIKKVICPLGVGAHFEYWGYKSDIISELDWYESKVLDAGWELDATPARHFSGRGFTRNRTLWSSFVLQSPTMKIFIGGDGGYDTHFADIGQKYGPFDLAIIEQGQYNQNWKFIHLLPDEVFQVATELKAKRLMPVHHSKFALSRYPWDEPLNKLAENSKNSSIPVLTPMIGEPIFLKDTSQEFSQWWTNLE